MEQQFKKLLQNSRDQNDPLLKTFEGALFEESAWFFQSETTPLSLLSGQEVKPEVLFEAKAVTVQKADKGQDLSAYRSLVLFVGDTYKSEQIDLLGKMIEAMKLTGDEFSRLAFDEELENIDDLNENLIHPNVNTQKLFKMILEQKPQVVVSLGATITNVLLGRREKLSGIHGQFIEKSIDDFTFSIVPIFHPDFLMINPNMKRTAWIDLQKVMERIGKI